MTTPRKDNKRKIGQIWRNDSELELQAQAVAEIYDKLQSDMFDAMVRKLQERGRADLEENPYLWQLEKLSGLHLLNRQNVEELSRRSGVAIDQLERIIENEGLKIYEDTRQQLGEERRGLYNPVTAALQAYAMQARGELENLTNSTLPAGIRKRFQQIVEQAVAEVVIGAKTRDKAIADTVMKWADKGFHGYTDAAGREWSAAAFARAIIKTTVYSTYNEMRTRAAREAGVNTFLYSMKAAAREMCAPLQGKLVTYDAAFTAKDGTRVLSLTDYGYGTAGGCLGVHCGHYLTPFVIGVNSMPEVPDYLKDLTPEQAQENAKIQAKQRGLERSIRSHKQRLHVAEVLGDADHIQREKIAVRNRQAQIRALIDQHDFLHRDYQREKVFN